MSYAYRSERPAAEGFYFVRFRGRLGGQLGVGVVKVTRVLGRLMAHWNVESFPVGDECFLAFAGPIPLPEDVPAFQPERAPVSQPAQESVGHPDLLEQVSAALLADPVLQLELGPSMTASEGSCADARRGIYVSGTARGWRAQQLATTVRGGLAFLLAEHGRRPPRG
jgi:hypothetical protein